MTDVAVPLFGRVCQLVVGNTTIPEDLRIQFHIVMPHDANTRAKIIITNLNETSRNALQSNVPLSVVLYAGYAGQLEQIFSGLVVRCWSTKDKTDWETHLETEDGEQARKTPISKIHGKTTKAASILSLADALAQAKPPIRPGNLVAALGGAKRANDILAKSVQVGMLQEVLKKELKAIGFQFRIVNGELQVCKINGVISENAAFLSAETGLIGSPEIGKKGVAKIRALIMRNLVPQRLVFVESFALGSQNGKPLRQSYRIEKTTFKGDTRGRDWYADLECSDGTEAETENAKDDDAPPPGADGDG